MKKIRITFKAASAIAALLFLAACQPTPDVAPVVNKSEGLPPGAIIEVVPEGEIKVIDAPGHWSETIERMEGHIKVAADADVSVPQISNTPVIELKQYDFTDERLSELVSYFAGDAKLYKEPKMTKAELENEIEDMENGEGIYAYKNSSEIKSMKKRAAELLEKAPETTDKSYIDDIAFTYPSESSAYNMDYSYIVYGKHSNDDEIKNAFRARVETGNGIDPIISAQKYDPDKGTVSSFYYMTGETYDQSYLDEIAHHIANEETLDNGISPNMKALEQDKNNLERQSAILENAWKAPLKMTEDEAVAKAQEILADLGASQLMGLLEVTKGVVKPNGSPDWDVIAQQDIKPAFHLRFYSRLDNLIGFDPLSGSSFTGDFPEQKYVPPFNMELIDIFINDDGVQDFSWHFMAEPVAIIAENTRLAPFDEITERVADHLYYPLAEALDEHGEVLFDTRFEITDAQLRAGYINAFEAPQNVWLLPIWAFNVKEYRIDPATGNERYFSERTERFNAIDGGYISFV